MGFPILGDPQYGSEESMALSSQLRLEGQQLCAKELVFSHPITGKQMRLCSSMDVGDPI
jgi:23S rRNA-/tRNA-specific pseudouridylate synthase